MLKKTEFVPMGDRVLVELIMSSETEGGIVLPDKQISSGIIKAIGNGVNKETHPLKVGDKVFLPRGVGSGERIVSAETNQCTHLLVPYINIVAVIK